jgi:hypothetical protein
MRKTRIWSAIPSRSRNFIARFALPQKIFGGPSAARLSQQVDRGVATVWYGGKEGRFSPVASKTLMVRRRVSAVSNHEARTVASSFETLAAQAPQDEGIAPLVTQQDLALAIMEEDVDG